MHDIDDISKDGIVTLSAHDRGQSLCYRCRRINKTTLFASGPLYHCNTLDELCESAKACDLCHLLKDGLLQGIPDDFANDHLAGHKEIIIRPEMWRFGFGGPLQAGLRVKAYPTDASCKLNWYLSHNGL